MCIRDSANTSSIASIEYAVAHLGVKLIVVLGHQSCGAVSAAIAGGDNGHNLNHLVAHLQPALQACPGGSVDAVVRENAVQTAAALAERSQVIGEAAKGDLEIIPAWYVLETGHVEYLK